MKRKKSPIFTFLTIFEIEKFTIIVKEKKCSQCEEKKNVHNVRKNKSYINVKKKKCCTNFFQ